MVEIKWTSYICRIKDIISLQSIRVFIREQESPSTNQAVEELRQQWCNRTDTAGRLRRVILGISEPTKHQDIAEMADCSPNAAKKHLERLADMGVVTAEPGGYARDEAYVQWWEAHHIATDLSIEEIIDRVHRQGGYSVWPEIAQ